MPSAGYCVACIPPWNLLNQILDSLDDCFLHSTSSEFGDLWNNVVDSAIHWHIATLRLLLDRHELGQSTVGLPPRDEKVRNTLVPPKDACAFDVHLMAGTNSLVTDDVYKSAN